jgi:mannose-1-phosphate guanylyltransferase
MAISGDLHVQGAQIAGPIQFTGSVTLGPHSRIIGPVSIGAGTTIEGNVLIGPYTSIGEGCTIRNHTKIFSSSIYNHVVVGRNCTISGSVIDNDTVMGEQCSIENDTIIGPRVVLRDGVVVHSGTRIWPEVTVEEKTVVREHVLNPKFDTGIGGS